MKVYEVLSAMENMQESAEMPASNGSAGEGLQAEKIEELRRKLWDIRQSITTPKIEEMKKLMHEKAEVMDRAEILARKLKDYEEADNERIACQACLSGMRDTIDERSSADERYEAFSGIAYIEETGALIEQCGKERVRLNQLNEQLNDGRAAYHKSRAEYFSLLEQRERLKEKIDILQHEDADKADTVLTLDHMIDMLQKLAENIASAGSDMKEFSIKVTDTLQIFRQFVSMLEVKVEDYAPVLPKKFRRKIEEILK